MLTSKRSSPLQRWIRRFRPPVAQQATFVNGRLLPPRVLSAASQAARRSAAIQPVVARAFQLTLSLSIHCTAFRAHLAFYFRAGSRILAWAEPATRSLRVY